MRRSLSRIIGQCGGNLGASRSASSHCVFMACACGCLSIVFRRVLPCFGDGRTRPRGRGEVPERGEADAIVGKCSGIFAGSLFTRCGLGALFLIRKIHFMSGVRQKPAVCTIFCNRSRHLGRRWSRFLEWEVLGKPSLLRNMRTNIAMLIQVVCIGSMPRKIGKPNSGASGNSWVVVLAKGQGSPNHYVLREGLRRYCEQIQIRW